MKRKKFKCKFCKSNKKLNYPKADFHKVKFCRTCNVKFYLNDKNKIEEVHYYFTHNNNYYALIHAHNYMGCLKGPENNNLDNFYYYSEYKTVCYCFFNDDDSFYGQNNVIKNITNNTIINVMHYNLFELGYRPQQVKIMFNKLMKLNNIL